MATFCSQCGRELKDGEVCNCTQNVQEDGNNGTAQCLLQCRELVIQIILILQEIEMYHYLLQI